MRLAVAIVAAVAAAIVPSAGAVASEAAASEIALGTHNTHYGDASFEQFAGVIGWQEVESPAARQKMQDRLGAGYKSYFPAEDPAKSVPISWRTDRFTLVGQGSVRTHGGEAGVTPARYVNWVLLQMNGTGTRFIVVNTHFISGAWSGHPERQARWNTHYDVLHAKVAELRRNHPNQPVFVLGDFNRPRAMAMPSPIRWVPVQGVSGVPIDHMYAPSNITHTQVSRLPRWGSDHFAYKMYATI